VQQRHRHGDVERRRQLHAINVTGGVLPCVLKISPATGPALYSVATGSGSSATANISPVTQLVVASLTGGDPAAYFTGFDATAAAGVTDAGVTAAVTAVKTTLLAAGVDLGTIDVLAARSRRRPAPPPATPTTRRSTRSRPSSPRPAPPWRR
jgi:hypothetical protein